MHKYLLLQPDEDGNPSHFINNIDELLDSPFNFAVDKFLDEIPENDNPQCWKPGEALLLKVEVCVPKVKATAFVL